MAKNILQTKPSPLLVLGSASPRRQKFLKELGLDFVIDPADLDETPLKKEPPLVYVQRIARAKAACIISRHPEASVLTADSTVCVGRRILGKPESTEEAACMLRLMAGRRHKVLTAVVFAASDGKVYQKLSQTIVKMRPLQEKDIQKYVGNAQNWQGLAGGYGLQTAKGGALVEWVHGSVSGVVGLPLVQTLGLLKKGGYDV